MKILARIQQMAASEILSFIDAATYERIKKEDRKPIFRAYVIGHEGISEGSAVGMGKIVKRWYASAIAKLYEKLKLGLKLFHNHAATNEHEGRAVIGELVGKALKDINERQTAIAITYIKPQYRNLPLDIASIEANIRLSGSEDVYDVDVDEITGIALGNSALNQPGFIGATLLSQIQAFAHDKARFNSHAGGQSMELNSIDEIRQFIKAQKAKPSDLFDLNDLADDEAVKGFIEQVKRSEKKAFDAQRYRTEGELDEKRIALQKELESAKKSLAEKDSLIAKAQVPQLFEKVAAARKLDKKQKDFIAPTLDKFEPKKIDEIEKELNLHLDSQLLELKRFETLYGVKSENSAQQNAADDQKKDSGTGPEQRKEEPQGDDKYLLPEFNPMLPR